MGLPKEGPEGREGECRRQDHRQQEGVLHRHRCQGEA